MSLNDQPRDLHPRSHCLQTQAASRMWSHLRLSELHTAPTLVLQRPPKPVQFVRVLVPRRMQERQRSRTSLQSEVVLNPAFSRPYTGAAALVELPPRLAITSVTLPMHFDTFS